MQPTNDTGVTRGPSRLRLSEFVQISEFFSIYITDICQTSESFPKSVNLKYSTLPTGEVGQKYYALKKSSPFVNSR